MEVVGRHALLFDDDAMAAFVNSQEALVQWNSLLIDRYDVRHLLSSIPKSRLGAVPFSDSDDDGVSLADLNQERYQDLPPEDGEQISSEGVERTVGSATGNNYQAVTFSYGNTYASGSPNNADPGLELSGFHPSFPLPESLLNNLPPTEKVHQIIARTAKFVSEHGGQSEIVLRVKQGDNPTFGFLMPDHHLHPYFRFLIEHQELLKMDTDNKASAEEKKFDHGQKQAGVVADGALSLLGSVYGSGDDEDGAVQVVSESKDLDSANHGNVVNITISQASDRPVSSTHSAMGDEAAGKQPSSTAAQKAVQSKRSSCSTAISGGISKRRKEAETAVDKPLKTAISSMPKVEELFILEPPSSMKEIVDKIVEFIIRNGKEFEAVLIRQNRNNSKFQFLLPSNPYHPYYLKVLQEAEESKQSGRSHASHKRDSADRVAAKEKVREVGRCKSEDIPPSKGLTTGCIPSKMNQSNGALVSERKERFKMIISGLKKDTEDTSSKAIQRQCGLSEDAATAIVLAATRGNRYIKSDSDGKDASSESIQIQSGMSEDAATAIVLAATRGHRHPKAAVDLKATDDSGKGVSMSEGARTSSIGGLSVSGHVKGSVSKPASDGERASSLPVGLSESVRPLDKGDGTSKVSVAKAIAKTVALAAANEADSSEASLTREQKQKAERLKRAKMFAAMIKDGSHQGNGLFPRLPLKQPNSSLSDLPELSDCKTGTTVPSSARATPALDASGAESADVIAGEREGSSAPVDGDELDTREKGGSEDDHDADRKKKHRSRSRRHEEDLERDHKHSRKKHRSDHHSSQHDRDDEHKKHQKRHSHHRHRHHHSSSEDDEVKRESRSDKHRRRCHREARSSGVEDGQMTRKSDKHHPHALECEDNGKKESPPHHGNSVPDRAAASSMSNDGPSSNTTEVPDDLRAKIRAMLLATM
ncbi:hypothetical protein ACLOJK_011006 [Asimina triloba]